jgi:hypothetical protein
VSLLVLALAGLGPAPAHFVARSFPPNALAESSWGNYSHAVLARPSLLVQWLRLPTLLGLALGLFAMTRAAFGEAAPSVVEVPAPSAVLV